MMIDKVHVFYTSDKGNEWTVEFTFISYRVVPRDLNPVSDWSDYDTDLEQVEIVAVNDVPTDGVGYTERFIRDQVGLETWTRLYDEAWDKLMNNDIK